MDFYCLDIWHWKARSLILIKETLKEKVLQEKCKRQWRSWSGQWIIWSESSTLWFWSTRFNINQCHFLGKKCPNWIQEFLHQRHGWKCFKMVFDMDFVNCCHWIILNNKSNKSRENNLISYELKGEKHGWRQSVGHDIPYKALHSVFKSHKKSHFLIFSVSICNQHYNLKRKFKWDIFEDF